MHLRFRLRFTLRPHTHTNIMPKTPPYLNIEKITSL